MSDAAPPRLSWSVRPAAHEDVPAVVSAVGALLRELGGTPPPTGAMALAARTLLDDPRAGALLVAEASGGEADDGAAGPEADGGAADAEDTRAIVGVLGVSFQTAIHAAGQYALIQDLWVHPTWRRRAVGSDLLAALFELARELQIPRAEVGLPQERYPRLQATEAFYHGNGFTPLGPRMRRVLP
jgi:GNAT superfamily N-acetyltransferase